MKVIPTFKEFVRRTTFLFDYEFEDVSIEPDSVMGAFHNHRHDELIKFCKANPEHHVISVVKGCLWFNKPMKDATSFYLGIGDAEPSLVCFENYKVALL